MKDICMCLLPRVSGTNVFGFCLRYVRGSKSWRTVLRNCQFFAKLKCKTVLIEPVSYDTFFFKLKGVSMSTSMFSVVL